MSRVLFDKLLRRVNHCFVIVLREMYFCGWKALSLAEVRQEEPRKLVFGSYLCQKD